MGGAPRWVPLFWNKKIITNMITIRMLIMEQMYSLKSAAKLLAVSVRTVRRLLHQHQIQVYRVGGNIRLKESDLELLLVEEKTLEDYGLNV